MNEKNENLLTLSEIASRLRVSKHTVQAWISPSSPNHRPEFAAMARHAGRKTLFVEEEVMVWLNQRRGAIYAAASTERSAYWRERFLAGRGLLKGLVKSGEGSSSFIAFPGGLLGLDTDPMMNWLADGPGAPAIYNLVMRSDGLVISISLASWILRRALKIPGKFKQLQDFIMDQNVFELAGFGEDALRRSLALPAGINELGLQNYCCCISAGASAFLTAEKNLLKIPGLPVISF
ncbi:MAG: helix-turn-helix transcriptional regulator [Candidatus Rifleibacteriota bacterium]